MASPASLSSGIPASGSRSPSQASSSTSPALDLDLLPLLDLCPSISTLRALLQVTASQVSDEEKRRRIARALLRAAGSGDVDLLAWLLDARAEGRAWLPSCAHSGVPTTILGVAEGRASQANGIPAIDFAALRDEDGAGPVVLAATFGHVDAVRMLVLAGADVDERDQCEYSNCFSRDPHYREERRRLEVPCLRISDAVERRSGKNGFVR